MDLDDTRGRVRRVILLALLTAMGAALLALMVISLNRSDTADPIVRRYYVRMAFVLLALLGLVLVVLVWMAMHHIRSAYRPPEQPRRTEHVDAWSLAGQRIEIPPEPQEPDEDDEDQPK